MTDKQVFINSIDQLREWLQTHSETESSVWLVRWKKGKGDVYLSYDEIVDELICFGWVDSLPRKLDNERTMLLISPRNPKSNWSGVNKARVERLTKAKRMQPAGLKLVELAKESGSWDFLNEVEQLLIPPDLEVALNGFDKAYHYFNRFPDSSKRGILEWIKNAKQAKTRENRIRETAEKAAQNIKANHPKGRDAGPSDN